MSADRRRRLRLLAIVGQAWMLGVVGGTAIDLMMLDLIVGLPSGLAATAPDALGSVLAASLVPALIGAGVVAVAPAFAIRRCLWLGAVMVACVTGAAALLFDVAAPAPRIVVALVFFDAALAALWCWHRTKGLKAGEPANLATIFE